MIHLGFEVGTGNPIEIPLAHLAVTGMTQASGKTTTLEALIERSEQRAVTFITKRGERSFAGGTRIQPFFRERADWVFVSSLIDATMGEKNKLLRAWLMKVCRGTKTLAEVQHNVRVAKRDARGFSESIYTEIDGYLELVVPQLAQLPPVRAVKIHSGLNVMDLSAYSTELQALVIKSVLEHVGEHAEKVITVIPEAWEFLPEGRGSPVKREAESLIRKGAVLGNFVWLDSQDLAGVWKLAVRAASVYLIGVQREANEIKRTLANIPGGISKPNATDIATLERGQFFACHGRHVVKTYVQPAWMGEEDARLVALGTLSLNAATKAATVDVPLMNPELCDDKPVWKPSVVEDFVRYFGGTTEEDEVKQETGDAIVEKLDQLLGKMNGSTPAAPEGERTYTAGETFDNEKMYQAIKARLIKEAPAILKVLTVKPEIRVAERTETIEVDGKTLRGRVALLILKGFFDETTTASAAFTELQRNGFKTAKPNVYKECDQLAAMGFVTKERDGYKAVADMKRNVSRT